MSNVPVQESTAAIPEVLRTALPDLALTLMALRCLLLNAPCCLPVLVPSICPPSLPNSRQVDPCRHTDLSLPLAPFSSIFRGTRYSPHSPLPLKNATGKSPLPSSPNFGNRTRVPLNVDHLLSQHLRLPRQNCQDWRVLAGAIAG